MTDLAGKRILLVEDEVLIALSAMDMIEDLGATVVGPAHDLDSGLALARTEALDGAVLDVNLNDARSDPIADALSERSVPVLFATGYRNSAPAGFDLIVKPYTASMLGAALSSLLRP